MTYEFFLENISKFVGKRAIFTMKFKATGEVKRGLAKKIWDEKTFVPLRKDSLIEILNVEIL